MSRKAVRAADLDLLIGRMEALGLPIEAVEITVDGAVRILTHRPATPGVAVNANDDWVGLAGAPKDIGRA